MDYLDALSRAGVIGAHPGGWALTEWWLERVPLSAAASVLEVGCGTGGTALALAQRGMHVTALDVRQEMIDHVRARARQAHLSVDAVVGSADRLPWPPASFDAVIGESVLVFADIPVVLREVRRVLKTSGLALFVEMVAPTDPPPGWHDEAARVYGAREVPTLASWRNLFLAAGFQPVVLRAGDIRSLEQEAAPFCLVEDVHAATIADPEVGMALAEHFAWMERFGHTLGYGVFLLVPRASDQGSIHSSGTLHGINCR
ncbi:class I SAM-dependent methyltransferase [Alicyclobacillus sendaiensis]|uniref:Class I SAM-dependent methyltransferase n=1 Tax=Alicyclobacillus sendaiensis PA2 TaxID=3029425 RepID=A0ABT6Y0W6_ALISE|nr:class I SAM-dependent methyltransferase [Alicyclobacillus sendaiensis]MDI9260960.1 class I SAM-dependent methyltransferase [Alicyclobacillus sendaiensis PA2]